MHSMQNVYTILYILTSNRYYSEIIHTLTIIKIYTLLNYIYRHGIIQEDNRILPPHMQLCMM